VTRASDSSLSCDDDVVASATSPGNSSVSSLSPPPHQPSDDGHDDVQRMSYRQLWDLYGCDSATTNLDDENDGTLRTASKQHRPIPTAGTWRYLRKVYNQVVRQHLCGDDDAVRDSSERLCYMEGIDANTVDDGDDAGSAQSTTAATARDDAAQAYKSGFQVAVDVRYSPGKGRGLFALEEVPKGQLVWASQYEGWMRSGRLYRLLLEALPTNALRCEVMTFSYYAVTNDDEDDGLDESGGSSNVPPDDEEDADSLAKGDNGWEEEEEKDDDDKEEDSKEEAQSAESKVAIETTNVEEGRSSKSEWERRTGMLAARANDDRKGKNEKDENADEEGKEDGLTDDEWEEDDEEDEDYDDESDDAHDTSDLPVILINLDEAALMNADWESPDGRQNVNVGPQVDEEDNDGNEGSNLDAALDQDDPGWSRYVALRDIRAGEEILCVYHDFARDNRGWAKVGL
jgi:SET domain